MKNIFKQIKKMLLEIIGLSELKTMEAYSLGVKDGMINTLKTINENLYNGLKDDPETLEKVKKLLEK